MRIAIVNDMVMAVETLRRVLMTVPEYQIAWIARDGADAVARCAQDTPDLILMDLVMPVMDGVEATRQIMQNTPCAIVVVTASVGKNASRVFEAMGLGALDAVSTPVLGPQGNEEAAQLVLSKIATIRKLIGKSRPVTQSRTTPDNSRPLVSASISRLPPLIAIGSSTGGPHALAAILSRLPASFNAAVVIVQHVDAQFAGGIAQWLDQQTPLTVQIATEGSRPEVGKVLLAGTNDHLLLQPALTMTYTRHPIDYPYRPSVDVFFKSAAQHWHRPGTAVLLTGMGRDGAEGMAALQQKGWHTIAQDRSTCIVYGMPKAAVELGAAAEVLPLDSITQTLIERIAISR